MSITKKFIFPNNFAEEIQLQSIMLTINKIQNTTHLFISAAASSPEQLSRSVK